MIYYWFGGLLDHFKYNFVSFVVVFLKQELIYFLQHKKNKTI